MYLIISGDQMSHISENIVALLRSATPFLNGPVFIPHSRKFKIHIDLFYFIIHMITNKIVLSMVYIQF